MTKTAEIAALDKFIAQLGTASYLGPWLADNRAAIVADISNDLLPNILLPGAARKHTQAMLEAAKADCAKVTAETRASLDALTAQTQRACDQQRRNVADIIARCCADTQLALLRGTR